MHERAGQASPRGWVLKVEEEFCRHRHEMRGLSVRLTSTDHVLAWAGPIASGETHTGWRGNLTDHHVMGGWPLDCVVRDLSGEPAKQKPKKAF